MYRPLSDSEIKNCCQVIVNQIKIDYPHFFTHVLLLYRYGLRISELFPDQGFYKNESGALMVHMQKTNYYRVIDADDFIDQFDPDVYLSLNYNAGHNSKALERALKNCNPYARLSVGAKGINSHLFRHNFIKQKLKNGVSLDTVQSLLNEKDRKNLLFYKNSIIYYQI